MNVFFLEKGRFSEKLQKVKARSGGSDSRSIRRVSCVLGDADLQFFCSRNNREGERETERKRVHFEGQGLRQTVKLRE